MKDHDLTNVGGLQLGISFDECPQMQVADRTSREAAELQVHELRGPVRNHNATTVDRFEREWRKGGTGSEFHSTWPITSLSASTSGASATRPSGVRTRRALPRRPEDRARPPARSPPGRAACRRWHARFPLSRP